MADASAASPPSPAAPSPFAADDLVDARLAPWPPFTPWPAPGQLHHHNARGGGHPNPLFTILPASALAIGLVLLVAVAVILVMTRRAKPGAVDAAGASCNGDKPCAPASSCGSSVRGYNNSRYYAAAAAGCIYGGRLGFSVQPRNRGAQVFTYRELESATDGFSECNVVGRGAYGVVFRGRLGDGTTAAIKRLQLDGRREGEREFRIEFCSCHRATVFGLTFWVNDEQIGGVAITAQGRPAEPDALAVPGGAAGLLRRPEPPAAGVRVHAQRQPQEPPPPLGIALDCARALEFLHEHSSPAVIHRDFKCGNILLDHNYRARVSDFGMAKLGSNKANGQVTTRVLGTTGYLAPEYASTGKLTTKSDVYSYGVVLLELLTGRVPVDTKRPPGQHVLVSWDQPCMPIRMTNRRHAEVLSLFAMSNKRMQALPRLTNREKLVQMVDPALIGQFSLKDLIQVAAITAMCIQTKADYRPLMTDVVQSLIPIVKTPLMSCTSTPLRPAHHHAVYMMSPGRGSSNGGAALETRCIMHGPLD
uniref:Protein kinase domain-containing protein n=1 Tax=Oryza brachyantha TaxID=4533 RepID=J3M6X7_ORYBR